MKLKKSVKKFIIRACILVLVIILGIVGYKMFKGKDTEKKPVKEVKVINQIEKYGYSLKENKPKEYKDMFKELEKILNEEKVDEEKYISQITKMYIYDFYSLNDKTAKTDIGGVEFVYQPILDNFLQNAQNTYYKYIESNIYNNRKQSLPIVTNIAIESVNKGPFAYGDKTDENAYAVVVNWDYTDSAFSGYQKKATLIWVHDDIKFSLVELQ